MNAHSDRLTIDRLLLHSAQRWPSKEAVVSVDAALTYGALERASRRLARLLLAKGAAERTRVGLILPNCIEFVIALYAISRIGAVLVPVNPAFTDREMLHILEDAEVEVVICRKSHHERLNDQRASLPMLRELVRADDLADLDRLLTGLYDDALNSPLGGSSIHSILYTSGTTGRPKGAVLSQRSRVINSMSCRLGYEVDASTRLSCPVPMFHSGGMVLGCVNVLAAGGTLIIPSDATPDAAIEAIINHHANYLLLVPTLILRLLESPAFQAAIGRAPISLAHGAAPMPTALAERLFREFPLCRPYHAYGTTEAPQLTALAPDEYRTHPSATGRPLPGTDVWVADEHGEQVPAGQVAEIVTAGSHVFEGYLNAPEQTQAVLRNGVYRTGDLASMDEDGIITMVGRTRDMIISGGFNVYAKEVEDVLHQYPGILQASVFGLPDDEWGEAVCVAIVLRPGMLADDEPIVRFCRAQLAPYKKPRHVYFVDALPLTPAGKVQKFKLVERFSTSRGSMSR